jgi:predicted HTH transcriptional regulator
VFFLRTMVKHKNNLAAKVKEQQALRSSLPVLSRQILELAKTPGEITDKEIGESTGANRNTIKVHLRKLASANYLAQSGWAAEHDTRSSRFPIYGGVGVCGRIAAKK